MRSVLSKTSFKDQILAIVERYIASGGEVPINPRAVARWAVTNHEWDRTKSVAITLCTRDISKALRVDFYTDQQGRRVRANHSIRILKVSPSGTREQMTLWDDHRAMPRDFAERSFQQRRQQIVGNCKQLKADVDSFNDRNVEGKPIQLVLDFTYDIAEDDNVRSRRPPQKG